MLAEWFAQIPARRLLLVLDCCFSGGMGAKVFVADATPRSVDSAEKLLEQVSGRGRLVLTETAPGVTVEQVVAATEAPLAVADDVRTMPIG